MDPSPMAVIGMASQAGVHPAIVAGRVRYDSRNYRFPVPVCGDGGSAAVVLIPGSFQEMEGQGLTLIIAIVGAIAGTTWCHSRHNKYVDKH